jgi:hypothetical protein
MAIGRISGALLFSDLDRQGTDLAFTTNGQPLVYMDFTNFRLGINTNSIVDTFTVDGTANVSGITKIYGNLVAASGVEAYDVTTGAFNVVGGAGITGNLYAGNLFANNFSGNISNAGGSSIFGNIAVTYAGVFGSLNTANAVITGGYINDLANLTATAAQFSNFSSGNILVSGGYISSLSNITATTGNVESWYATALNATNGNITTLTVTNFSTGNAVISGGYITSLSNAYITTSDVTNFSTGNAVISGGYIAGLANATITTGNVESWYATELNGTNGNITNLTATNFSSGNVLISGGYISQLSNITAVTANLGNLQIEDITLSSLVGNIIIEPLLSDSNALTIISGTSALQLPSGTTVQQPSNAYPGAIRWNTSISSIEVYSDPTWIPLLSEINNQVITPDGVSNNYVLDYVSTAEGIIVSINGTLQQPGTAYTVSGSTISFTEVPLVSDIISIRFISAGITENNVNFGNIAANLIPYANVTYDLGSTSNRWRDLWLAGNSIHLGAALITSVGNTVQLPAGSTVGGANVDITSIESNIIVLNANVEAANAAIITANSAMKTYVDVNIADAIFIAGSYGNAVVAEYLYFDPLILSIRANLGSTQIWANANIATINANLGSYQTYANANVVAIQDNLSAYQTYANANVVAIQDNLSAYQTYANANVVAIQANLGSYQTYANANVVAIQANLGAYQTYANANVVATQANLGSFQTYANTKIGTNSNSNLVVVATTATTSTTTGALIVRGGTGIAGAAVVAGNVTIGTTALSSRANLYLTGGNLAAAPGSSLKIAEFHSTVTNASYIQFLTQRHAQGADWTTANTRIQQMIDVTPQGYIEFNPNGAQYGVAIGSQNFQDIARFHDSTGNVVIRSTTATTSTTTGALVVAGGVGVGGSIRVSGNVGIGTSTPQTGTLFNVAGISDLGRDGSNGYIQVVGGGVTNTGYIGFYTSADVRQAYIGYIGTPNDALNIETDAGSNKPIRFATNATPRMTIASSGNVTVSNYLTANLTTTTSGPFDSGTGATWTNPRTTATWAKIEIWGGGGGGGGSASGGAGGGGGGGAYFTVTVPFNYLGATETYTVGGGGAGVASATNGSGGGTTTFTISNWPGGARTISAYGGGGGGGAASTVGYSGGGGGGVLGTGGSAAGGTIGQGGAPIAGVQASGDGNEGYGGGAGSGAVATPGGFAYYGGGGGGCGENATGTGVTGIGGSSVYGGGGGGGGNDSGTVRCPGGTSTFGGKGGDGGYGNNTTPAQDGTVPGGGGGGSDLGTAGSGAGAAGRLLITIW